MLFKAIIPACPLLVSSLYSSDLVSFPNYELTLSF